MNCLNLAITVCVRMMMFGFGMHAVNNTSADWVPVTRPHGPCSAAAGASGPSVADMLRWDEHRAHYIQDKLSIAVPVNDSRRTFPPPAPNNEQRVLMQGTDPSIKGNPGTPPQNMASQQVVLVVHLYAMPCMHALPVQQI
jgi:hypothetical protein